MNTAMVYIMLRLIQLGVGGAMFYSYFQVRAKRLMENPVPPEVLLGVDLLFIVSILVATWLVFSPIIKPLKKQLKQERQKHKQ